MSTASTLIKYTLFFSLVAAVCSEGVADPKQADQYDICEAQLNNSLPQTCNRSLLIQVRFDFPSSELAAINAALAQNCISACIDPIEQFWQCVYVGALTFYENTYLKLLQNFYCGQENGEYCVVRYNRLSDRLTDGLLDTCPDYESNPDYVMVCNSTTPQSCYDGLSSYSSILGCCADSILPGRQNCQVTIDPPCGSSNTPTTSTSSTPTTSNTPTASNAPTSTTSIANGLCPFAALSMIAVAILGLLF